MAVSLQQLATLLDEVEIRYETKEGHLLSRFSDGPDDNVFDIVFLTRGEGTVFEAACLGVIPTEKITSSEHKPLFLMYLLDVAWNTSFGTPELDKRDGELRVLVEVPLADATMTSGQVGFIVRGLMHLASRIRTEGSLVLETGRLPEPKAAAPEAQESQSAMARLSVLQLIQAADGRRQVRAMLADSATPDFLRETIRSMLPLIDALDQVSGPR